MPVPVLHCYADFKWTGPSEPVAQLCRELTAMGWRSDLACMFDDPSVGRSLPRKARAWGVRVLDELHFDSRPNVRRNLRDVRRLAEVIEAGDYGLVHCHGTWDQFLAAWALRRLGRPVPLVRTDHGGREYRASRLHRWYYGPAFADHLVVLSDRFMVQAVGRVGRAAATVSRVRGGVDVGGWCPTAPAQEKRAEFGVARQDVLIGVVARVQPHRRFEVLLEAMRVVQSQNAAVKVIVLGRGSHKERVLDRPVVRLGLEGTVIPAGYRHGDYREVLATFDAGLMLVPGSDGSCRAALEMAAMGKPLIVARRGVLPDIVVDGQTGIVVEDTPGNLAEAILEMARVGRQRRRQWGQAARRRMEREFALSRRAGEVVGVYRKVLGRVP